MVSRIKNDVGKAFFTSKRVLGQGSLEFSRFYILLGVYQHMRNVRELEF